MGLTVIDPRHKKNLPLEDFMKAMGFEPVNRNGNFLTFESPYSTKGEIVVTPPLTAGTTRSNQTNCMVAFYDLAYEIIGSANKSELNLFIASEMKKVREVKMYDVTANGKENRWKHYCGCPGQESGSA